MSLEYGLGGTIVVLLLGYLVYAMVRSEQF